MIRSASNFAPDAAVDCGTNCRSTSSLPFLPLKHFRIWIFDLRFELKQTIQIGNQQSKIKITYPVFPGFNLSGTSA